MIRAEDIVRETNMLKKKKLYGIYVDEKKPKSRSDLNVFGAFIVGGMICMLGQIINNAAISMGSSRQGANLYTIVGLILLSVIITSFGEYSRLVRIGGAGTIVPITGFANSVASAAIEYRRENLFEGIGAQIFSVAGPVILYGIVSSSVLGLVYYIVEYLF